KSDQYAQRLKLGMHDGSAIDAMAIYQSGDDATQFGSNSTSDQKWVVFFQANKALYDENGSLEEARRYGKEVGANVLLFNYRGTGESTGEILEGKNLVEDGCRVIDFLKSHGVPESNILLYGQSIGGATATLSGSLYDDIRLINQRSFSSLDKAASSVVKK